MADAQWAVTSRLATSSHAAVTRTAQSRCDSAAQRAVAVAWQRATASTSHRATECLWQLISQISVYTRASTDPKLSPVASAARHAPTASMHTPARPTITPRTAALCRIIALGLLARHGAERAPSEVPGAKFETGRSLPKDSRPGRPGPSHGSHRHGIRGAGVSSVEVKPSTGLLAEMPLENEPA